MAGNELKSASSGQPVPVHRKIDEALRQFGKLMRSRNPFRTRSYERFEQDILEYRKAAEEFGGFELQNASLFEIGCGQRPYRLMTLLAHGFDASAIDIDKVLLQLGFNDVLSSFRTNGTERTIKTTVRYLLFDLVENRKFKEHLSKIQGQPFEWPYSAIIQGDAADPKNWPPSVDFIYSEDVFEHIPREGLPALCKQMAARLSGRGLALIRPMIFTGIQGGHNVDYYSLDPSKARNCPPWDHLRENKFPSNTYLNQVTRAEFRTLFDEYFEILDETVVHPDKGREFMTPELRGELSDWTDDELFSNTVRFVLRPKR